jgi:pimeloyl-ACP methyl ester carboxylesterase
MRISLGDVSLWFDVSGPSVIPQEDTTVERPVLAAVHGGPGLDHLTVKSALGLLAEDFQVVYFDLRGHGRSDHSSAEFWNMRTWADARSGCASRWSSAAASAASWRSATRHCSPIIPAV